MFVKSNIHCDGSKELCKQNSPLLCALQVGPSYSPAITPETSSPTAITTVTTESVWEVLSPPFHRLRGAIHLVLQAGICPACLPHPVLPQAPLGSRGKGTDRSSSLPAQPAQSRLLLSCLLLIHSCKHSIQYPTGMNDPLNHPMLQVCPRQTAEFFWGDYKRANKTQLPIVRLFLVKTIDVFAIY